MTHDPTERNESTDPADSNDPADSADPVPSETDPRDEDAVGEDAEIAPESSAADDTSPPPGPDPIGLPLEIHATPEDAEPCPKCGAPLRGDDALVCLRCGYDLRTLESLETETTVEETEEGAADAPRDTLVRHDTAPEWLSFGVAGVSLLVLLIGILAGVTGLYPAAYEVHAAAAVEGAEFSVEWSARFAALLRLPVLLLLWLGAGAGALRLAAWYWHQPFGQWRDAMGRLLAVLLAARLVALLHLPWRAVEVFVEIAGQAAIAVGLIALLFRLPPKKAGVVVLLMSGGYLLLYLLAKAVVFVT